MEKLSKYKWTLVSIFLGLCVLGGFSMGIPLIFGRLIGHTSGSIYITQYIFIALAIFYLFFLPLIFNINVILNYYKIPGPNIINGILTVIIIIIAFFPVIVIIPITAIMFYVGFEILHKPPYKFAFLVTLVIFFLLGVRLEFLGKRDERGKLIPANHTSPFDYLLTVLLTFGKPWNAIAGKNLRTNREKSEDKLVSSTLGILIDKYGITVDRDSDASKSVSLKNAILTVRSNVSVIWYPEGGRATREIIMNGILLRSFHPKIFKFAWQEKVQIQPVGIDFAGLLRGKEDCWGIRPGLKIKIYHFNLVNPTDYDTVEAFVDACKFPIENMLNKSRNVKRFQRT